jgi:hypothetical protein
MNPRELGGSISRAAHIFVWVPYTEVEPDEEIEAVVVETETAPAEAVVAGGEDEGADEDILLDNLEGYWLPVTRVQARELQHAAIERFKDDEDVDILAEEHRGDLYIGMGPLP